VKRILTATSFEIYHHQFDENFLLRQIHELENIEKWIDMVAHSNIVTAVDQFRDADTCINFQLVEMNNGGNMYSKI
jgi:hypothetical protein